MFFGSLVIFFFAFALLLFQKCIIKTWSTPADIYTIWSLFLIVTSILVYNEYNWKTLGILWWLFSCFLCQLGFIYGFKLKTNFIIPRFFSNTYCGWFNYKNILFLYFMMGIMYSILLLWNHNFSLLSLTSQSALYEVNNYMQGYRYGEHDNNEDIVQQICLSFTYALPICIGHLLPLKKVHIGILYIIIALVPNILISTLNNTKAGVILAVILIFTGYLMSYVKLYNKNPRISGRTFWSAIVGLAVFLSLMFALIKLRYNSDPLRDSTDYIFSILIDYIFACTVNFDYFFMNFDTFDFSSDLSYMIDSNILTANAFWIATYGYVGTLLVWFIRGVLSGISFSSLKKGKDGFINRCILSYMYVNAIYFFTYEAFIYTTVIIGVFLLYPFWMSFFLKHLKNNLMN